MSILASAQGEGARLAPACAVLGLSERTVQRWLSREAAPDRRAGPKRKPENALSEAERERILALVNSPQFRGLSPQQIVPRLADEGTYLASESTIYRLLREQSQLAHRGTSRPRSVRAKPKHKAAGPNRLWSWDITYLKTEVAGRFFYLYLVLDVWSRKIVGWEVHWEQRALHASDLMKKATEGVDAKGLVLHADNGGPMKGATMLATLQRLGVVASFSRPHVSDDNPYSEALFRTLKYRPGYPTRPFATLEAARSWVEGFVAWYNQEHLHSGIRFITPSERHAQQGPAILTRRKAVYEAAKKRNPSRWSGSTRSWSPVGDVHLNPDQLATEDILSPRDATPTDPSPRSNPILRCLTSAPRRLVTSGTVPGFR